MSTLNEEHMQLINDCMERESRLTEWEGNFLDSIYDQLGDARALTPKQLERLEAIWERVTAKG